MRGLRARPGRRELRAGEAGPSKSTRLLRGARVGGCARFRQPRSAEWKTPPVRCSVSLPTWRERHQNETESAKAFSIPVGQSLPSEKRRVYKIYLQILCDKEPEDVTSTVRTKPNDVYGLCVLKPS